MFPIGTDCDGRRPAIATILLIVLNVIAFAAMRNGIGADFYPGEGFGPIDSFLARFELNPHHVTWWQLLTYAFVHEPDGFSHLGVNMVFLWVFGKPIESHLGFWRFLPFYLSAAVVSGLTHCAVSNHPVIGASGAVFGVVGLFVAFFPRSQTRVFSLFFGLFTLPSMWLVIFYAAIDVLTQLSDFAGIAASSVASMAHLGGLAYGMLVGLLLLRLKVAPRGDWDLLYAITQFVRRRKMRAATRAANATPWMSGKAIGSVTKGGGLSADSQRQAELRAAAQSGLRAGDTKTALANYRELLALAPSTALPAEAQLDMGNRALAEGDAQLAAQAYRNYIASYGGERRTDEVRLLLAVVLVRRLDRRDEARPLVGGLRERLHDADQRALAEALEAECAGTPS